MSSILDQRPYDTDEVGLTPARATALDAYSMESTLDREALAYGGAPDVAQHRVAQPLRVNGPDGWEEL